MTRANQLEELSDQDRQAVLMGADALKEHDEFTHKSFDRWMTIAKGVAPLCDLAERPGMARKARKHLLADNGYKTLTEGTVSRLRWMAKLETAIRIWRDTLKPKQRDDWNSPSSICNRCPAVKKAIAEANKDKPRRQRKPAVSISIKVEKALDVIADYGDSLDDLDHRATLAERLRKLADQFAPTPAPQSPTKRTTKPTKTSAAKATATKADGLDWTATDSAVKGHQHHEAAIAIGVYRIDPLTDLSLTFGGYVVKFVPTGGSYTSVPTLGAAKTAAKAKAIAAADYAKRSRS